MFSWSLLFRCYLEYSTNCYVYVTVLLNFCYISHPLSFRSSSLNIFSISSNIKRFGVPLRHSSIAAAKRITMLRKRTITVLHNNRIVLQQYYGKVKFKCGTMRQPSRCRPSNRSSHKRDTSCGSSSCSIHRAGNDSENRELPSPCTQRSATWSDAGTSWQLSFHDLPDLGIRSHFLDIFQDIDTVRLVGNHDAPFQRIDMEVCDTGR